MKLFLREPLAVGETSLSSVTSFSFLPGMKFACKDYDFWQETRAELDVAGQV